MDWAPSHAVSFVGVLFAVAVGACNSTTNAAGPSSDCSRAQPGMPCSGDVSCLSDRCGGEEGFFCVNGKWELVANDAVLPNCPEAPPEARAACPVCWPGALECKYADGKRAAQIVESGVTWSV